MTKAVFDTLVKEDQNNTWAADLPLLAWEPLEAGGSVLPSVRKLCWAAPDEVHVADSRGALDLVHRHFPEVCLLAVVLGPRQLKGTPCAGRALALTSEVTYDRLQPDQAAAQAVQQRVRGLLAPLLAVAEASRRYNNVIQPLEVLERLGATRFQVANDVWVRWSLSASICPRAHEPRRLLYDDVFLDEVQRDKETRRYLSGTVIFDAEPGHDRPPLKEFAATLAVALLDATVEADWYALLGEADTIDTVERLDAHLRRCDAAELVGYYEGQLSPLTSDEESELRERVAQALGALVPALRSPKWDVRVGATLSSDGLQGAVGALTEDDLRRALKSMELPRRLDLFRPRFSCHGGNLDRWSRWADKDGRRTRLLRLAFNAEHPQLERPRDQELMKSELAVDLEEHMDRAARALGFSVESAVGAWLGEHHPGRPLLDHLPPLIEFKPLDPARMQTRPRLSSVPMAALSVTRAELIPQTQEDRRKAQAITCCKGADAETRVVEWAAASVNRFLEDRGPETWLALRSALPRGGKRWRAFEAARLRGSAGLLDLLHISKRWGSAGFDVLSVEDVGGILEPVRTR